jgi:Uma2 family endonuclease
MFSPAGKRPTYPYDLGALLLVIEVQSPGNPLLDYQIKRRLYLAQGVPEYWIANPDARVVSRWRGKDDPGEVLTGCLEWLPVGMTEPLLIDLPELFAEALDDE